jgi:outer membrane protein
MIRFNRFFFLLIILIFCHVICLADDKITVAAPGVKNISGVNNSSDVQMYSRPSSYLKWVEGVISWEDYAATDTAAIGDYENLSLRNCMELARAENFSLLNSERNLLISHSNYREAKAEFIPSLTMNAETGIGKTRTKVNNDREETHTDYQQGSVSVLQNIATGGSVQAKIDSSRVAADDSVFSNGASISFNQPLLRGGGMRRGLANVRSSELSLINREISNSLQRRSVHFDVISQYYGILRSKRELQVSLDALEEKKRFLEETKIKFELDQIPESEISRADIQYLQEKNNVVTRRRNFDDQLEGLLIILGLPLDTQISISDVTKSLFNVENLNMPDLNDCIHEAISNRLELMQDDISIRRQNISCDNARNDLLPDLDLFFDYSTNDTDNYFRDSYDPGDNNSWNTGLSLSIPLPNIGRKEAFKRSKLTLDNLKTDRLANERDIIREVKQSYRRIKANESSLNILNKTVSQAFISLEQERGRFDVGLSTSNDVRNAQDDLFETQTRYFGELLNYQVNIARIFKAVGRNLY